MKMIIRLFGMGIALFLATGCGEPVFPAAYSKPKGQVEDYRRLLEQRLLEKYNNLPDYAGQISRVELFVAAPPLRSMDGRELQVEYDQIVRDKWGRRVPALEKEYFIVTFGPGEAHKVREEPSLQIGLKQEEGIYSERIPIASGRVGALRRANAADSDAEQPAPILPPLQRESPQKNEPEAPVAPVAGEDDLPVRLTAGDRGDIGETVRSMAAPRKGNGGLPVTKVEIAPELAPLSNPK